MDRVLFYAREEFSSDCMKILNIIEDEAKQLGEHCQEIWNCSVNAATDSDFLRFQKWLTELDEILVKAGVEATVDIAIVDGCQSSNGHALLLNGQPTAWVSVSNYPSDETIKVFGTHEVIHALHYGYVSEYHFESKSEKDHVGRQLATEGLATFVTEKLLNLSESEALWSDYLTPNDLKLLMDEYRKHQSESATNILRDWDKTDSLYFYANDRSDVDKYRSGYFIGRSVIARIAEQDEIGIYELLTMPRSVLDAKAKDVLKKMSL